MTFGDVEGVFDIGDVRRGVFGVGLSEVLDGELEGVGADIIELKKLASELTDMLIELIDGSFGVRQVTEVFIVENVLEVGEFLE